MTRQQQRRARLRAEYGFDFPEDFYRFWEFVYRLSPLDPLHALAENLGIVLVGPFEVLSGRFDGRVPRHSLLLHWRYHDDPPEFFTVLAGNIDGLHWGYYLDDPDKPGGCLASYYARDAYELSVDGDTLFEAVRLHLEFVQADLEFDEDTANASRLEALKRLRDSLAAHGTADRPETGEAYTERFAGVSVREMRVIAETLEGAGIVADPESYRPLSVDDRELWRLLRRKKDPVEIVNEALAALRDGYPATALKLGKDLWATSGKRKAAYAAELLTEAYAALPRPSLARVLQTHLANRALPSVDILDDEEGNQLSSD